MSVFNTHQEELEKHEFMLGKCRGRLAVSLDILTNALTSVGMHGVYCHSARHPNKPKDLESTKELISSVMQELKQQKALEQSK
jgi:hypothetical protein